MSTKDRTIPRRSIAALSRGMSVPLLFTILTTSLSYAEGHHIITPRSTQHSAKDGFTDLYPMPTRPTPPMPPNYINPQTRAPLVITVNAIMIGLALLAVVLRTWSRLKIVKRLCLEDWLAIVGWAISFAVSFSVYWMTRTGLGLHWWDVPVGMIYDGPLYAGYIMTVLSAPSMMAVKCSILVFYLRLEGGIDPYFRLPCITVLGLVLLSGATTTALTIFACRPLAAAWDFRLSLPVESGGVEAKCINMTNVNLSGAVVNMVLDLIIWALPFKILWGSGLPKRQKIQVGIVFGLGGFACIASMIRLYTMRQANKMHDWPWEGALLAMWTCLEINVGIICCSLPAIKPLLSRWLPVIFGPGFHGSGNSGGRRQPRPPVLGIEALAVQTIGGSDPGGAGRPKSNTYALGFTNIKKSLESGNGSRETKKSRSKGADGMDLVTEDESTLTGTSRHTISIEDGYHNLELMSTKSLDGQSKGASNINRGDKWGYSTYGTGGSGSEERIFTNVEPLENLQSTPGDLGSRY